jgi:hypothetical protein
MDIQKTQANSSVNSVQQFSALSAFRNNKTVKPAEEVGAKETASGTKTTSTPSLLDKIDVNEIRECAKTVGEFNITDEDIKYGLIYGRSVIAEWLC